MRVLDIDLDFFLADCCEPAPAARGPMLPGMNRGRRRK